MSREKAGFFGSRLASVVYSSGMETKNFNGQTLRTRRVVARKTAAEVAEAAGCSVQYVYDLETGARKPPHATVVKLARSIGCRPSDLYRGVDVVATDPGPL